ncbi:MAG: PAS domain S-box protein, partial [Alphaproteobacteria bacterium]
LYENPDDRAMVLEGLRKDERFVGHDIMFKKVGGPSWPGNIFSHSIQFFGEGAVLTAVIDITEAKKSERLLRDSERKFRDLIDGSVQGIFIHQNGRIVYANKASSDMFGLDPDETVGLDVMTLIADVDVERMRERLEIRRRGDEVPRRSEFELKRGDGPNITVDSLSRDIEWGGKPAVQITVVDITEQKRAEKALRDSEQQLRVITDSLPVLIGYIDTGERYVFLNKTAEKWHDRPAEELYGKTLEEVLPKPLYALNASRFKAALSGERVNFEDEMVFPNGDKRHISGTYVPHFDEDGSVVGFFALGQNVTRQKVTEAQLRQAQKMEAVGQLTGGVAHDFNNLLTVIRGNLEMIVDRLGDMPELHGMSERAIAASDRAGVLTQRLLAFSRTQALSPRQSDLNRLVAGMNDLLRRTTSAEIEIEVISAIDLWRCEIDRAQMESALLNLAVNARDAMPAGGRLTIETANTTVRSKDIDATGGEAPPGQYVTITVTDTGEGMSPETAAQAFEPFFTTKNVGKGSGLGLSMVYGFVKQSGGHVRVDSEQGSGSSFRIFLPRFESGAPEGDDEQAAGETPRGNGQTVLLVEDDTEVRRLVRIMLEGLGYHVVEADCGPVALDLLDGLASLDLLLTDVVLPNGMDGREIAEETRRRRPEVRVLYMSGYTDGAIVHRGRLDHAAALLRKPFLKSEVARAVRDSLNGAAN